MKIPGRVVLILFCLGSVQASAHQENHIYDRSDAEMVNAFYDAMAPRRVEDPQVAVHYYIPTGENPKRCAKSFEEAVQIAQPQSYMGTLLTKVDEGYYFDLVYVDDRSEVGAQSTFTFYRIFNCFYIGDLKYEEAFSLMSAPRNPGEVRRVSLGKVPEGIVLPMLQSYLEQFWHVANHNISGALVLERLEDVLTDKKGIFEIHHTMLVGGDWGLADTIYFYKTRYIYDSKTNELTEETELFKVLSGRTSLMPYPDE